MSETTAAPNHCARCGRVSVECEYLCPECFTEYGPNTRGSQCEDEAPEPESRGVWNRVELLAAQQRAYGPPSYPWSIPTQWVPRQVDRRCPKCGQESNGVCYIPSGGGKEGRVHDRTDEHLDMRCLCGFRWEADCLDAETKGETIHKAEDIAR